MSLSYIETFTGKRFYPLDPYLFDVDIVDIAHALSHQCRFAGHTREFYSVAEHSYWVAYVLEEWGADIETQLWGLLHDASEAYLVDLPTPLKSGEFGEVYRKAEATLQATIMKRFNLPEEMPELVIKADAVMLSTEARDFMPFREDNWRGLRAPALSYSLPELGSPRDVKATFLRHFSRLETKR